MTRQEALTKIDELITEAQELGKKHELVFYMADSGYGNSDVYIRDLRRKGYDNWNSSTADCEPSTYDVRKIGLQAEQDWDSSSSCAENSDIWNSSNC